MINKFKIGNIEVSANRPPLVIAEIGINHNGSLDAAIEIADSAIKSGAEVIKHQTHIVEDEMSEEAKKVIPGNAKISIYDPMVSESRIYSDMKELWNCKKINQNIQNSFFKNLKVLSNHKLALENAYSIVIQTPWDEFKNYDWKKISKSLLNKGFIFDSNRILKDINLDNIYFLGI